MALNGKYCWMLDGYLMSYADGVDSWREEWPGPGCGALGGGPEGCISERLLRWKVGLQRRFGMF